LCCFALNQTYCSVRLLVLLLLCNFLPLSHYGQDTSYLAKPPLVIARTSGPVVLDGLSHEPAWQQATSLPFIVFEPVWGQAPTENTEMLLAYDDEFLYVAGRCHTRDSATIVARNLVRDGWRGDDWMTVHIDSRYDKQNAFVFSIYPLGSRYDMATGNDAIELGNATFNPAFNMIWEGRSVVNRGGWFFELKIPLYNLRFKPAPDGKILMGISATRAIQHKQEYHQFPAVPQNAVEPIMKPSLKGPVVFEQLRRPRLFWLTPYALLSRTRRPGHLGSGAIVQHKPQLGLDVKMGVSPYLTLDLTVNPDFSQVEADDQLVNLTRFSLFFPERRLFFQEQAGLFEFNLGGSSQLFYSRRIGINNGQLADVYGGARLTGKLGRHTDLGWLNLQAAPTWPNDSTRQPTENFGALRLRRKILNDRSFVGLMFTNRNRASQQNYALGLDALLNPVGAHYLLLNAATTLGQTAGRGSPSGLAASRFSVLWETRRTDKFHHKLGYIYSGRDFDPQVGFVDRSNFHNYWGSLSYGKFAKQRKGRFQYKRVTPLNFDTYQNAQTLQWETAQVGSALRLLTFKATEWTANLTYNYEFLSGPLDFGNGVVIGPGTYQFMEFRAGFTPPRFRSIRLPVRLAEGSFYGGRRFNFNVRPVFNVGRHWEFQLAYDFTYLRFAERNLYAPIHLARLQVNFALDLHLSVNWICQYNSNANRLFNNLRLRYNFKDGHDLYMVWNEDFASQRQADQALPSGNQTLVVKYSYTFDKVRLGKRPGG
jgi:hypothetical protein